MNEQISFLFPILLMIVIWYFLLIRPQNKKMKAHRDMVNALQRGDKVLTQGGIFGKVVKATAEQSEIEIEIAQNVHIKILRSAVQAVLDKDSAKA